MICFSIYIETFLDFTDVPSCVWSGVCDAERRMWICKPTGLNRGRGIFLLKSREEVEALRLKLQLLDDGRKRPQRRPQACVVQRWVNTRCLRGLIFSAELEVQSVSVKSARLPSHSLSYPFRETQADSPPDPETATSFLSVTSRSRCCWTGGSSTCARTS